MYLCVLEKMTTLRACKGYKITNSKCIYPRTIHIAYVLAIVVYVMLGNNIKIAQFRN